MKYERAKTLTDEEVLRALRSKDTAPSDRIKAVLAAIFHGSSHEFAGDMLLQEFSTAEYEDKIYLMNLFGTFYGAVDTLYRIDEGIALLGQYKAISPTHSAQIQEMIDELQERKLIRLRHLN